MRGMYDIKELGQDNEAFLLLTPAGKKNFYKQEKEYENDTLRDDNTNKSIV